MSDLTSQLFAHLPGSKMALFSCNHVTSESNLRTLIIPRGPQGSELNFKFSNMENQDQVNFTPYGRYSVLISIYSYLNSDTLWPILLGSCLAVWWSFCLPIKLLKRSRICGTKKESWALYEIRKRHAPPSTKLGGALIVIQVFMESTADVHQLLAQYAEEIRSNVSSRNISVPFTFH
jgi:hypothetical protein